MTTNTLDEINIPTFIKGDEGWNHILKTVEPDPEPASKADPEFARASLTAAKPIYEKADAAQITAEKALAAVAAIEKASQEREAATQKAAEERQASEKLAADEADKKSAQAKEYDAMSVAFSTVTGGKTSIADLFKHEGYDALSKKQIDGVDFPITYEEAIGKTMDSGKYDQAAKIMKGMFDMLNPSADAGKTVSPSSSGQSAARQEAQDSYVKEMQALNKRYTGKFDYDSIVNKTKDLSAINAKYGR